MKSAWLLVAILASQVYAQAPPQKAVRAFLDVETSEQMWNADSGEYWTRDVAELCYAIGPLKRPAGYLRPECAAADRDGLGRYSKETPKPACGYWFAAIPKDERGEPYGQDADKDGNAWTNKARYAFCAVPAEPGPGRPTLVFNERGILYWKDLGKAATALDRWPGPDPTMSGWTRGRWDEQCQTVEDEITSALWLLVLTEGHWRCVDGDRNGAKDYWTMDVAGMHHRVDSAGAPLGYIDAAIARADRTGFGAYSKESPEPWRGYWFRAVSKTERGVRYSEDRDGDGRAETNVGRYAFCAYPAEYGKSGTLTYIVDEMGCVYSKDLEPETREGVEQWPGEEPTEKGWSARG